MKAMIDSEIVHEEAAQEAVEALVSADIIEEAAANDVVAVILTAGTNVTMSG